MKRRSRTTTSRRASGHRRAGQHEGGAPAPTGPAASADYEVGFRKPPVRTRFRAGTSGNPRGRPKKSKNMKTIARETLNGTVVLNEGGHRRRISYLEAILRKQIESGLKGSERAAIAVIKICTHLGLFEEAAESPGSSFSAAEEEFLDGLLKQLGPKQVKGNGNQER